MLSRLLRFCNSVRDRYQTEGVTAFEWAVLRVFEYMERSRGIATYRSRLRQTNIYSEDWDVLIILDACRTDTLQDATSEPEYDIFDVKDARYSVGSHSKQWMERTFVDEYSDEMTETTYINGNPHSELCLNDDDFGALVDVWKSNWEESLGTVPPEPITDHAIKAGRTHSPERMIVHYMQPHFPSIPYPELDSGMDINRFGSKWKGNIWDRLRKGAVEKELVKKAFEDNLRYVLDDVKRLLDNVDADSVVVTSDHGTAFGEHGFYGHQPTVINPVRRVPWFETSGEDLCEYEPTLSETSESKEEDLEARLRALGYRA